MPSLKAILTFDHDGERYSTEILIHELLQTDLVSLVRLRKAALAAKDALAEGRVSQGVLAASAQKAEELLRFALEGEPQQPSMPAEQPIDAPYAGWAGDPPGTVGGSDF